MNKIASLGAAFALAIGAAAYPSSVSAQTLPVVECVGAPLGFGEVQLGETSTQIITCTADGYDYRLEEGGLWVEGGADAFTLTPLEFTLPHDFVPFEPVDIEVAFSPSIVGNHQARYWIQGTYNVDPPNPKYWYQTGMMQGDGVYTEAPLPEDILAVIDFIDESVTEGALEGDGPGASADNRLNALRNMIFAAGDMTTFAVEVTDRALYKEEGIQDEPRISGDRVVFTNYNQGNGDIFVGDVNDTTQTSFVNLTSSLATENLNDVDGDLVAYTRTSGLDSDIVVHDVITDEIIVVPGVFSDLLPRIEGDYVVYQQIRGGEFDIFGYQLSTGTVFPVSDDVGNQADPAVSQGRVVFNDEDTITFVDLSKIDSVTGLPVPKVVDTGQQPDIDGSRIVYAKDVGDDRGFDVFLYEIGSSQPPLNITDRAGDQADPRVFGSYVTYGDDSAGNADIALYLIDKAVTYVPFFDPANQYLPDVGPGHVVYVDDGSGDPDIHVVDFSITTSEAACEQLQAALKHCDGEPNPDDFVTGTAREELAAMIEGLLVDLGCE